MSAAAAKEIAKVEKKAVFSKDQESQMKKYIIMIGDAAPSTRQRGPANATAAATTTVPLTENFLQQILS